MSKNESDAIIEQMAGHLDPSANAFIPSGSRNSRTDPYYDQISESNQWYPQDQYGYRQDMHSHWDDRYPYDDHRYRREPYQTEPRGYPTSQELRDFYQELQTGGWESRKQSRMPVPQRQTPPRPSPKPTTVQHGPMPSQAGSRVMRTPYPAERHSPPRRSPPKTRSPPKQRISPKSFASVARSSLERKSAASTPSPTTEHRINEAVSGLSAPESPERPSPNPVERTKNSPPKIDVSYDADAEVNLIRSQLEFYFSDKNLQEESNSNLIFYMLQDNMWVPLHVVCALPKIRDIVAKRTMC